MYPALPLGQPRWHCAAHAEGALRCTLPARRPQATVQAPLGKCRLTQVVLSAIHICHLLTAHRLSQRGEQGLEVHARVGAVERQVKLRYKKGEQGEWELEGAGGCTLVGHSSRSAKAPQLWPGCLTEVG